MYIFDLKKLDNGQEVPKVLYRPFKIYNGSAYFEKIVVAKDHEWTDGIVEYNLETDTLTRIDEGPHVEEPMLFDIEVPFTYEDIEVLKDLNSIYYSATTEIDSVVYIKFYEIDLIANIQRLIISFSYKKDHVLYRGMELLTDGYILFRITDSVEDDDSGFRDRVYLIDVAARSYYEIHDDIIRLSFGNKYVVGNNNNRILIIEEYYVSETEQLELLTLSDVELAFDLPDDVDQNYIHKNGIHYIPFKAFLSHVKNETVVKYQNIDDIFLEGSLRLLGQTDKALFYRKRVYDHILKDSKDFVARQMVGKELIMKISKATLKTSIVGAFKYPSQYLFSKNRLYQVNEDGTLKNIENNQIEASYLPDYKKISKFMILAYIDTRLLIVKETDTKNNSRLILYDKVKQQEFESANDIFVLDNYLFIL